MPTWFFGPNKESDSIRAYIYYIMIFPEFYFNSNFNRPRYFVFPKFWIVQGVVRGRNSENMTVTYGSGGQPDAVITEIWVTYTLYIGSTTVDLCPYRITFNPNGLYAEKTYLQHEHFPKRHDHQIFNFSKVSDVLIWFWWLINCQKMIVSIREMKSQSLWNTLRLSGVSE